jgi:hypothetical protein
MTKSDRSPPSGDDSTKDVSSTVFLILLELSSSLKTSSRGLTFEGKSTRVQFESSGELKATVWAVRMNSLDVATLRARCIAHESFFNIPVLVQPSIPRDCVLMVAG